MSAKVSGKLVTFRLDHDKTDAGPTFPKVSSRCIQDMDEVHAL